MVRAFLVLLMMTGFLAACDSTTGTTQIGADGQPLPKAYKIRRGETGQIQNRMLDSVNSLRAASGAGSLVLNSKLTSAASAHSRDMAKQGRPWHFGSDGSSPIDRVVKTGYPGQFLGENISETFESELVTLAAWMDQRDTRSVILDPKATNMGFSWHQESNGRIWWTLITGS